MHVLAFFFIDPMYLIIVGPAILLALVAQGWVKSAFAAGKRVPASSGMSGAQAAQRILDLNGIRDVRIERIKSWLGDHYDSRSKVLRLSPEVYDGRSLASLGVAAHEVGHALQHAHGYAPLAIRNGLVPMASLGSNLSFILILAGIFLHVTGLALAGFALFAMVVLFQIVNLPVEFNASTRARALLLNNGMITQVEDRTVAKVLNAAAMTYVAATITAIAQLLYFGLLVFGGRR